MFIYYIYLLENNMAMNIDICILQVKKQYELVNTQMKLN